MSGYFATTTYPNNVQPERYLSAETLLCNRKEENLEKAMIDPSTIKGTKGTKDTKGTTVLTQKHPHKPSLSAGTS